MMEMKTALVIERKTAILEINQKSTTMMQTKMETTI